MHNGALSSIAHVTWNEVSVRRPSAAVAINCASQPYELAIAPPRIVLSAGRSFGDGGLFSTAVSVTVRTSLASSALRQLPFAVTAAL